jgi:hypothetical protein
MKKHRTGHPPGSVQLVGILLLLLRLLLHNEKKDTRRTCLVGERSRAPW